VVAEAGVSRRSAIAQQAHESAKTPRPVSGTGLPVGALQGTLHFDDAAVLQPQDPIHALGEIEVVGGDDRGQESGASRRPSLQA